MILVEFIGFLTYTTRFKANTTLFMEKYTNENAINFAGSCFVYIKKSVVLLMIVTINLPNGCVKVIVLFYCLSLRHRKWLNAENGRFLLHKVCEYLWCQVIICSDGMGQRSTNIGQFQTV